MNEKRQYRMRERAKSQEETRLRIVEATMHLHEEIGPRATTISAIAEKAGVQRLTVYRHFPDETAVFQACTAHWLSLNPPPDPQAWAGIADPKLRLRRALDDFYAYYGRTRRMWTTAHRDVADVPALHEPMAEVGRYLRDVGEGLAMALPHADPEAVRVTIQHAIAFPTWESLDDLGLSNADKTDLVLGWVGAGR